MIFLVVLGFGLMIFLEMPELIQKKYYRELVVFCILTLIGLILSILLTLGVELPYLDPLIKKAITGIGKLFY
jgi:hypothetical protein